MTKSQGGEGRLECRAWAWLDPCCVLKEGEGEGEVGSTINTYLVSQSLSKGGDQLKLHSW